MADERVEELERRMRELASEVDSVYPVYCILELVAGIIDENLHSETSTASAVGKEFSLFHTEGSLPGKARRHFR